MKIKKTLRITSFLLSLFFVIGSFYGCSDSKGDVSNKTTKSHPEYYEYMLPALEGMKVTVFDEVNGKLFIEVERESSVGDYGKVIALHNKFVEENPNYFSNKKIEIAYRSGGIVTVSFSSSIYESDMIMWLYNGDRSSLELNENGKLIYASVRYEDLSYISDFDDKSGLDDVELLDISVGKNLYNEPAEDWKFLEDFKNLKKLVLQTTWDYDSKESFYKTIKTVKPDIEIITENKNTLYFYDDSSIEDKDDVANNTTVDGLNEEDNLYDEETIREFLAQKYTCTNPPFYTVLDHVSEDGLYVYHIYELVVNEDESHSATIDWVEVNPKTGKATTFDGFTFYLGETDIEEVNNLIESNVVLSDDEEIESREWVDADKKCFRVSICYKEQPENGYKHKRDYFFYFMDEKVLTQEVDYSSRNDPSATDRIVFDACDFNAKLEDVTFDGKEDLIIFLGYSGSHGMMLSCAYICTDDGLEYCRSFEDIPNYGIELANNTVTGHITHSAGTYAKMQYKYDKSKNEFAEVEKIEFEYDEALGEYVEVKN